ncbi:hypothetical protein HHI36_000587 [Cryptolaemus montrouzieri]|uniref:Uncharacterized protein n=1 Tax=Cryptolaemus montrouzieri TaxID=559131 RepID=A0ABD2P5J1_9CUCU
MVVEDYFGRPLTSDGDELYRLSGIADIHQLFSAHILFHTFQEKIQLNSIEHIYSTRNKKNRFETTRAEKRVGQRSFTYLAPRIYAMLPQELRTAYISINVEAAGRIHKEKSLYPSVSSVQQPLANFKEGLEGDTSKDSLTIGFDTMEVDVVPENVALNEEGPVTDSESDSSELDENDTSSNGEEYEPISYERKSGKYDQKHLNDSFK